MIINTEQACIGDSSTQIADPAWQTVDYTGILAVDAKLEPLLQHGGLVLVSGYTGSGKTVLAGQIASCMAMNGRKVAFLSTEVEERELLSRTLSCLTDWPYSELKDGLGLEDMGGFSIPVLSPRNDDFFSANALRPYAMLRKHVDFNYRRDFTSDPVGILMEELPAMMEKKVDCIILDYLRVDGVVDGEQVYMEEVATEVMNTLGNISIEYGIPVFVFCQRNYAAEGQSKKEMKAGRMGGISDFPAIENLADLTIELTYPHSRPAERHEDPGTGTYSRDRHFIVSVAGNGSPVWVPVLADHDFQRFIERDEDHGADADSDVEFGKRVRQSERKGFIKVSRDVWEEILEIRHVPTRIVYLAMALNANHKTGRLNWSGTGLEELLSMDDSVIRRALANLEQLGLVERVGQSKRGKRREWQIVEYHDRFNNADADNFVVLARNLLDEAHAPLREDHRVFAVWVHLLFETRFLGDKDGEFERGQWPAEYKRLALDLKITVEEVKHAIQKLEDLGCIKRWNDPDWGNEVIMLPNYDRYQWMVPWPAKQGGRTTDELRTNFGQTSNKLRTIKADELTVSRRTNSGQTTDELRTNCGRTSDEPRTIKETCKHENRETGESLKQKETCFLF